MNLAISVLGSTAVNRLKEAQVDAVLVVGKDRVTRGELAKVGCYNFTAARNLSAILKELKLGSLRALFDEVPPTALALPHLGVFSLAVLGAAFEAKGIGGETPLENYAKKHVGDKKMIVTFDTLKRRELEESARERKDRRRRKAARRNQAQELRVERLEKEAAS
jgi:hypothetical protein